MSAATARMEPSALARRRAVLGATFNLLGVERYRALARAIARLRPPGASWLVAVSSARPGEGKTTTAVNVACALAQIAEARVLLVDCDLRRPRAAARLGIAGMPSPGLSDLIREDRPRIDRATWMVASVPGLGVLTAGRPVADPHPLLRSPRLGALLHSARDRYDHVVIDAPPMLSAGDGALLAPAVDGFVIVVQADRTSRRTLAAALQAIPAGKVLGLVLNGERYRHGGGALSPEEGGPP